MRNFWDTWEQWEYVPSDNPSCLSVLSRLPPHFHLFFCHFVERVRCCPTIRVNAFTDIRQDLNTWTITRTERERLRPGQSWEIPKAGAGGVSSSTTRGCSNNAERDLFEIPLLSSFFLAFWKIFLPPHRSRTSSLTRDTNDNKNPRKGRKRCRGCRIPFDARITSTMACQIE